MTTDRSLRPLADRIALLTGLILGLLAVAAAPAQASASEEQQGARLLQSFQAGKQDCRRLSRDQFELIGEYVMGRMLGSSSTHEAMNAQMRSVMGSSGEVRAHTFMGQRFTGCASGSAPAAFGSMMGMMGGYAGTGDSTMGQGQSGTGHGGGGMGGSGFGNSGDSGWSSTDTVLVVVGVLLVAALGALAAWRPWRRAPVKTPLDLLSERFARGEIDGEEYERRRKALGGLT